MSERLSLKKRLFPPLASEERERRLGLFRTLMIIQLLGAIFIAAVCLPEVVQMPTHLGLMVGISLGAIAGAAVGYRLARRVSFYGGAALLLLSALLFYGFFVYLYGTRNAVPYLLLWPVMMTAILLEPPWIWAAITAVSGLYLSFSLLELYQVVPIPILWAEYFSLWHEPQDPAVVDYFVADTLTVLLSYLSVALFAWIAVRSLHRAARQAQTQAVELDGYRLELEERVEERTAELSQALTTLRASAELIREMGSPVLPIMEGVLLAPLIGSIDSERARLTMDRILAEVAERRARAVILDITAVPIVDTAVVKALVQTAMGVRLLGAQPILVGIRAEVAQTMVELNLDLRSFLTRANLQEGLAEAARLVGLAIVSQQDPDPPGQPERSDKAANRRKV